MNKVMEIARNEEKAQGILYLDTKTSRALVIGEKSFIEVDNVRYEVIKENARNCSYTGHIQTKKVPVFAPSLFNGVRLTEKAEKDLKDSENGYILYKYKELWYKVSLNKETNEIECVAMPYSIIAVVMN